MKAIIALGVTGVGPLVVLALLYTRLTAEPAGVIRGAYRGSEPPARIALPDFVLQDYEGKQVTSDSRERAGWKLMRRRLAAVPTPFSAGPLGVVPGGLTSAEIESGRCHQRQWCGQAAAPFQPCQAVTCIQAL